MKALLFLVLLACVPVYAQSFLTELKAEPNAAKRAEKALVWANTAFDEAHDAYSGGHIESGDAQLDYMTKALAECVQSLQSIHKPALYKKAELNVSTLQRKLSGLLDGIGMDQRGWADYTVRKLEEIHEQLLEGVMRK